MKNRVTFIVYTAKSLSDAIKQAEPEIASYFGNNGWEITETHASPVGLVFSGQVTHWEVDISARTTA